MHATSAAAYEFTALPPGDYYIAAVGARGPEDWRDPRFLDRLVGAATKVTLNEGDEKTLALRTTTPGGR
jgi:hypothetical protein